LSQCNLDILNQFYGYSPPLEPAGDSIGGGIYFQAMLMEGAKQVDLSIYYFTSPEQYWLMAYSTV
jgi:hypothetical protein